MPSSSPLSFRQLVATQFANRPRLREVMGAEPDGYYLPSRERSRGPWLKRWNGEWMPTRKPSSVST